MEPFQNRSTFKRPKLKYQKWTFKVAPFLLIINFSFKNTVSDHAKDLILSLLDSNPDSRPTLEKIYEHPWMNELLK